MEAYILGVNMIKYNRTAFLKFDTELNGNAFARGPVTVQFAGLVTLAPLFNDSLGTIPKDNPVFTDDNGAYNFFVADGDYDIFINKDRVGEVQILNETIAEVSITPNNEIVINSITDLPAAESGLITQPDEVIWVFGASVTLPNTDRIIVGNNSLITSNNVFAPMLTYNGVSSFITSFNKNFGITNININCPNAQAYDISSNNNQSTFLMDTVRTTCKKFGTMDDLSTLDIINSSAETDEGMTVLGDSWFIFSTAKFALITSSATFVGIDFGTSVHSTLELSDYIAIGVPGGIGIKGAAASANLLPNALATVVTSEFIGVTPLSGISLTDIRWDFKLNSGLSDSGTDGLLSIEGNTTETVITDTDVAVKVVGTWTSEELSHFTADGTGRLTFIAERDRRLPIDATINLLLASSESVTNVTAYIAINGSIVSQTGVEGVGTVSKSAWLSMIWEHTFVTGDFVEVFVENNDDLKNIIGSRGIIRVR